MKEPIRVLQCVNKMDRAGLETFLMNYYRNVDRNKIQFDFLTHRKEKGAYDEEILSLGGRIYYAPRLMPWNYFKYRKFMKQLFDSHPEYKIVHSHIDTMSFYPLREAKRNCVPFRISHSHTSKLDIDYKLILKFLAKIRLKKQANIYFACGEKASDFLYGGDKDKTIIINNAIDIKKYSFSQQKRNDMRKKLNIDKDSIVLGHVGRFIYIKNQLFLLDVFKEFKNMVNNSKLLLIGNGSDESLICEKISNLELEDSVLILKDRSDVDELYQVMDYFVMPSLFEGLPLVAVEAQANGLKTFVSDGISKEVLLTSSAKVIALNNSPLEWAREILSTSVDRNDNAFLELENSNYNIKSEAKKLEQFYIELINEEGGFDE